MHDKKTIRYNKNWAEKSTGNIENRDVMSRNKMRDFFSANPPKSS